MLRKLRALFYRTRFEREMEQELLHHREAYAADLIAGGMAPEEAERRAKREFGALLQVKDECRQARGLYWPDALARDLRYAARQLRQNLTFTLTAVLTLALCIGANTAIYSVVDAVLLRPLPYPDPARLALAAVHRKGGSLDYEQLGQDGRTWEALSQSLKTVDLAVLSDMSTRVNFVGPTGAGYVSQQRVGAGFFRVLGVPPLIGREFTPREDRPAGPAVAVIGSHLWRTAFHANPRIAGSKILLRGEPYTILGVMPPDFQTAVPADVWTPLRASITGEGGGENYEILGRLRPGVAWPQANAEIAAAGTGIVAGWHLPANRAASFYLEPFQTGMSRELRRPILILWTAVALVLLIGCVNISGLLLARSGSRAKEIATRLALGSGRGAVVRQMMAESMLLGGSGGLAGVLVGWCALQSLKRFTEELGIWQPLVLDARVLAVTLATSLAAAVLFGLYPAFATSRTDLRSALAQSGRGISSSHRGWPRRLFLVCQVALGVVLLVGAGLLIRTVSHLMGLRPGFDARHVIAATLPLQDARYATTPSVNRLFDESLSRIRQIPGVEAAAVCLTLPYQRALQEGFSRLDGINAGTRENTTVTYITPSYFDAFKIPLVAGSTFQDTDRQGSPLVAIVNEKLANKFLGGRNAVGSHIKFEGESHVVIGVAGDVQVRGGGWGSIGPVGTLPGIYVPASQLPGPFFEVVHTWFSPSWVVRSAVPLTNLAASLQQVMATVDPQLPFAGFHTMDQLRSSAIAMQRLETILLGSLATLALLLSAVGIYGLVAHSIVERTREMGIRLALGSSFGRAVGEISFPVLSLTIAGLGLGCVLARAATTAMKGLIWGVTPGDPVTFLAAPAALLLIAVISCLVPSLRIARIQPASTLRE